MEIKGFSEKRSVSNWPGSSSVLLDLVLIINFVKVTVLVFLCAE